MNFYIKIETLRKGIDLSYDQNYFKKFKLPGNKNFLLS